MANKRVVSTKQPAGSPENGEPVFLVIGKLRRPHGIHGEMLMEVITDFPERISKGMNVTVGPENLPLHINSVRPHKNLLLIAFTEYSTPEEVGIHRNQFVYVRTDTVPDLPIGDFYHHQIIGLIVLSEDGKNIGEVTGILETGANDVLIVRVVDSPELLLPMVDEFILDIDLDKGKIIVRILPGLIPSK